MFSCRQALSIGCPDNNANDCISTVFHFKNGLTYHTSKKADLETLPFRYWLQKPHCQFIPHANLKREVWNLVYMGIYIYQRSHDGFIKFRWSVHFNFHVIQKEVYWEKQNEFRKNIGNWHEFLSNLWQLAYKWKQMDVSKKLLITNKIYNFMLLIRSEFNTKFNDAWSSIINVR